MFFLDTLTLEDGTDWLSENVGMELPLYLTEAIPMCYELIKSIENNPSNTPCLFVIYCWIGNMFQPCRVIIRPLCEPSNVKILRTSLGYNWHL